MTQDLRVIAVGLDGRDIAVVDNSTLAREAEARVEALNTYVGNKHFDNLGLDVEIGYFDWKKSEKVSKDVPTIAEYIAEHKEEVSFSQILAEGGSLLDLMMA